jgi:hypothetical protein
LKEERTAEEKQSLHEEQSLQDVATELVKLDGAAKGRTAAKRAAKELVNCGPAKETKQSVSCSLVVNLALARRLGS